jgi:hypothetical protein
MRGRRATIRDANARWRATNDVKRRTSIIDLLRA